MAMNLACRLGSGFTAIGRTTALLEERQLGHRIEDVVLQAADDVGPVALGPQLPPAIHERRVEQLAQRGEGAVVAVVRRGGGQDQAVAAAGQDLGQPPPQRVLAVLHPADVHAVMGLVDDHRVVAGPVELLQHPLLLEEIDRHQAQRDVVEGIRAKLRAAADLFQLRPVDHFHAQAEPLRHLDLPLLQQRTGGRDDEDAVGQPPGGEFGEHEARLAGLAQADAIAQQQPHAAHADRPQDRHELVGLDAEAARLDGQQGIGAEGLLQEERLVVDEPVHQRCRPFGPEVVADRLDRLEGVKDIQFVPEDGVLQPITVLASRSD